MQILFSTYLRAASNEHQERVAGIRKGEYNMNDPIVVWPPGTFYMSCSNIGPFYDCTNEYPGYAEQGYVVCCPA